MLTSAWNLQIIANYPKWNEFKLDFHKVLKVLTPLGNSNLWDFFWGFLGAVSQMWKEVAWMKSYLTGS